MLDVYHAITVHKISSLSLSFCLVSKKLEDINFLCQCLHCFRSECSGCLHVPLHNPNEPLNMTVAWGFLGPSRIYNRRILQVNREKKEKLTIQSLNENLTFPIRNQMSVIAVIGAINSQVCGYLVVNVFLSVMRQVVLVLQTTVQHEKSVHKHPMIVSFLAPLDS